MWGDHTAKEEITRVQRLKASVRNEQIVSGGEGEIRTHGTREGSTVFETAAFDHSATSPLLCVVARAAYQPNTWAKISGATMEASDSIRYFGVLMLSFSQVIFSFGTAPEYEP